MHSSTITGTRMALFAVAGLLTVAAALAIGILLFGDFGSTEGRILVTTALLAGYALVALPAAILRDRRRAAGLVIVVAALAFAAAALSIVAVWTDGGEVLGKAVGTVNAWLVAAVQPAALAIRRGKSDPRTVRTFFGASSALVVLLALMFTVMLWTDTDSERFGRVIGALIVLDILLVALQPILARARPSTIEYRLRLTVTPETSIDVTVEAPDLATAAAKAIRAAEHDGHGVLGLAVGDRGRPGE